MDIATTVYFYMFGSLPMPFFGLLINLALVGAVYFIVTIICYIPYIFFSWLSRFYFLPWFWQGSQYSDRYAGKGK